jgi:phosphatidylserine/phosphatidylglycerophosphate/cardiolipin synthase-like enzyme
VSENLVKVVEQVVNRLPASQVDLLARGVSGFHSAAAARARVAGLVPTPAYAEAVGQLLKAWETSGDDLSGKAVALALQTASLAGERERAEQSVEIVWTGPQTPAIPLRLTRQVLIDVIRAARRSLIVVSFAAYKVEVVVRELLDASGRGVDIRLVLEMGEASGGTLRATGASDAFAELRQLASFYVWPLEKRPVLPRGRAALHAKAAVADDQVAFVTSANLTGHAIRENMELGILIRGGAIPRQLLAHFRQLMSDGVLAQIL